MALLTNHQAVYTSLSQPRAGQEGIRTLLTTHTASSNSAPVPSSVNVLPSQNAAAAIQHISRQRTGCPAGATCVVLADDTVLAH